MKGIKTWSMGLIASVICLTFHPTDAEAGTLTAGKSHIGTFEGSTTFTTSSSNGIHPGLFLEVRDADGNLKQYESEDGVITVPNTKEGAYVTKAKLLGKTKYVDQDTGELLDQWEEGRNLKLESVQGPVLKTQGKNLFNATNYESINNSFTINDFNNTNYLKTNTLVEKGKEYTLSLRANISGGVGNTLSLAYMNSSNVVGGVERYSHRIIATDDANDVEVSITFTALETDYIKLLIHTGRTGYTGVLSNIQLEQGSTKTLYKPYQSSLLSANEEIELRGIGGVRDELDLVTGEVVQHIDEVMLDKNSIFNSNGYTDDYFNIDIDPALNGWKYAKTASKPQTEFIHPYIKLNNYASKFLKLHVYFNDELPHGSTFQDATTYLKKEFAKNSMKIQYQLDEESIKPITLTSTYAFNLISDGVVKVNGSVIPTIYSVTVPSQPLTFAINPNAEAGQQFIAPEFSITNEGTGPVELELKSFTQKTNVLNDVLPDHHSDWTLLDKTESRDFALALVPKASEAWLTLQEGPKYVANTVNTLLGKIKPKGTVDFSFTASHGTVFDQNLFPEYQLVFTFGF